MISNVPWSWSFLFESHFMTVQHTTPMMRWLRLDIMIHDSLADSKSAAAALNQFRLGPPGAGLGPRNFEGLLTHTGRLGELPVGGTKLPRAAFHWQLEVGGGYYNAMARPGNSP